jgi:hypothetical protein
MASTYFKQFLNDNYATSIMAQYEMLLNGLLEEFLYEEYIYNKTPYDILVDFLIEPLEDKYDICIDILNKYIDRLNKLNNKDTYRIVFTIPDGTVWYDSSKGKKNTWDNFESKSINENHNTRAPFMNVLIQNNRRSFETKYSSSTKKNEYRLAYRFGVNKSYPLGVIGFSFSRKEI